MSLILENDTGILMIILHRVIPTIMTDATSLYHHVMIQHTVRLTEDHLHREGHFDLQ